MKAILGGTLGGGVRRIEGGSRETHEGTVFRAAFERFATLEPKALADGCLSSVEESFGFRV